MRLIDADKLKVLVAVENDGTITTGKLVTALFDDMETVEAIPIEWIEQYIDEHWSDECHWDGVGRTLEKVIKQWEKECGK